MLKHIIKVHYIYTLYPYSCYRVTLQKNFLNEKKGDPNVTRYGNRNKLGRLV